MLNIGPAQAARPDASHNSQLRILKKREEFVHTILLRSFHGSGRVVHSSVTITELPRYNILFEEYQDLHICRGNHIACPPSRPSDVGPEGRHWRRAVVEVVGPMGGEAAGGGLVAGGEDCFFGLPLALLAWLGKPASATTPTSSTQHLIAKSHRKIF